MAQVNPVTLGQNFFLLIGALILLGVGFLLLVALWTGLKVWLFRARLTVPWLGDSLTPARSLW
jgi:hypothetical protein